MAATIFCRGKPSVFASRASPLSRLKSSFRQPTSPVAVHRSQTMKSIRSPSGPMTDSNVRKLVSKLGKVANLPFPVHPHMLRHACGYRLANEGHETRALQAYLGPK